MSPQKIFYFIFSVLISLAVVAAIFPAEGLSIGSYKIKFPQLKNVIRPEKPVYVNVKSIIDSIQIDSALTSKMVMKNHKDSINPADLEKLRRNLHQIQFPGNNREVLLPFFKELRSLKDNGKLIRVLHYGDSQVEGDRITSYLRQQLQKTFGGYGPGLISILEPTNTSSISRTQSDNWKRYTVFGKRNPNIKHNRYGLMGSIARFEEPEDEDTTEHAAWIDLKRSPHAVPSTQNFTHIKILYGNVDEPVAASITDDTQNTIASDTLKPVDLYGQSVFNFNTNPAFVKINLEGSASPDFYGILLDGNAGISVDNIPQRGSSGTEFIKMDHQMLAQLYKNLNVKLLILEYGVNVAPYLTENYRFYEDQFYKNLMYLKSLDPELRIIVISISDVAAKVGENYETQPNIEKIRDAQKSAAFRAECAFWDLYEAMGGRNSMPSWVLADPPLAGKDFTHFTWLGSRLVAEMFYQALIYEYYVYLQNQVAEPEGENQASISIQH